MIRYEQTSIEFLIPPSEPFLEQVRLAPTPIREHMAVSTVPADGVVHFDVYAHLESIDPDKNRCRFYTLTWQPSLFGGGAIVRRWGRIGTEGQWRAILFGSRKEAQKTGGILKRRLGHEYQVVSWE